MRQIALDTETTGLSAKAGERIIEIALIEIIDNQITGNNLHFYFNPEKEVHPKAAEVHGMTWEKLAHHPKFFEKAKEIKDFMSNSEIIIHNAEFDVSFLRAEFERSFIECSRCLSLVNDIVDMDADDYFAIKSKLNDFTKIDNEITCTLEFLRKKDGVDKYTRGYKLEQQCAKYGIEDNREKHSAIEDATMLAKLYLKLKEEFDL